MPELIPAADLSGRDLTLLECDHCGSEQFNAYRDDHSRLVLICDACGRESDA